MTMADLEGDEVFDKATLGECATVCEERVGDGELLYFRGCKNGQVRATLPSSYCDCSDLVVVVVVVVVGGSGSSSSSGSSSGGGNSSGSCGGVY